EARRVGRASSRGTRCSPSAAGCAAGGPGQGVRQMAATTKAMTTDNGSGGGGAVVVAGCGAGGGPGGAPVGPTRAHAVGAEVVAQSFGSSPVVVEWHANRHLRGVTRRVPGDARELLVNLDYVRSKAETVAQAAAAEGKHALQLAALKEYRECTQAIC